MRRQTHITAAAGALGMLFLILDSRCALESSKQGLDLCIQTVIPSLFPFLFLSNLVTSSLWGKCGRILKLVSKAVQLPSGTESLFLAGFLGGYPAGAAAITSGYHAGYLDKKTANRLLCFCSNAGPAFLFGMISPQFPQIRMAWCLWGIHILSAVLVGAMCSSQRQIPNSSDFIMLSTKDTMQSTLKIMGTVCGWIILFRIIIGFLDRWILWILPQPVRVVVWGLLELSNGCCALTEIETISLRFIAASVFVNFGGCCVVMQTASTIQGLSLKNYCYGKLLQTVLGMILAAAVMRGFGIFAFVLGIALLFLPKRHKKIGRNPEPSVV